MKQIVKKKEYSVKGLKEKMKINISNDDLTKSVADKPLDFIPMPEAFQKVVKLPGFPMGYMSIITGWSNTGKSSCKNAIIASCINNGILPVIFETENNFDFQFAIDCGMKATPIYGDVEVEQVEEETGEIFNVKESRIIDYEGDFLYFDSRLLADRYGNWDYSSNKEVKSKRKIAVIEDIAKCITELLDLQDNGEIQQPMCFIWDSVGSIPSYASLTKNKNNMYDAGSISQAFDIILNNRIPTSRSVNEPYTNTFICVNKIWNDAMNSMNGIPSIELKGGKFFTFASRLIIHLGGTAKASTKKLTATVKGETVNYGIVSKITVKKNHLPTPFNLTYQGELAFLHNGIWGVDEIDSYKKTHMKRIVSMLEQQSEGKITSNDVNEINFGEADGED